MFELKWTEIRVKTTAENEDVVSAILYDLGVMGLAIEDPRDILERAKDPSWDYIDSDELLESLGEGVIIKAYFPETEDVPGIIEEVRQAVYTLPKHSTGEALGDIELSEVYEKDWANNWKKFYKTTKIGQRIVIKPSWEEYNPGEGEVLVELDPGMAFGTGTHETTRLCAEELEKHVDGEKTVLDVGCGSGILSIIAAKLGAKKVVGVDIDELAVKVSNENMKINNVSGNIEFRKGDLLEVVDEKFDVVVANILAEVIVILNRDIKRCLKEDGVFIASGIILDKVDLVKKSLEQEGLKVLEVREMGEWCSIVSKINS